jgi:hypothetical protein
MRHLPAALAMVTSALWLACTPARAQSSSVVVTLQSARTVVQHEPVVVDLGIFNALTEEVTFDLGIDRKSNLQWQVRRPDGRVLDLPRLSPDGLTRLGRVSLPAGGTHLEQYVLDEWTTFADVGTYRVQMTLDAVFHTAGGERLQPATTHTFEVSIVPLDRSRLRAVCDTLADRAMREPGSRSEAEARFFAARALVHMVHPVVVPCLHRVAQSTTELDSLVVSSLAQIGTMEARNVLFEMLNTGNRIRFLLANDAVQRFRLREWP